MVKNIQAVFLKTTLALPRRPRQQSGSSRIQAIKKDKLKINDLKNSYWN